MTPRFLPGPTGFLLVVAVGCGGSTSGVTARSPAQGEPCIASVVPAPEDLPALSARGAIVVRPGDTTCLVVGSPGQWRALARVDAQTPHIQARVTVERGMTMLAVRNATSRRLAYRAAMRLKTDASWRETSIIPVMAGLVNSETWQDPIEALAMFDIRAE